MRRIVTILFLLVSIYLFLSSRFVFAQAPSMPKPITGTFLAMPANIPSSPAGWYPYFDDIKAVGMDTVIFLAMGEVYCDGSSWSYLSDNKMETLLTAAYDKGVKLYLGLAGSGLCTPGNEAVVINISQSWINQIKTLNTQHNWGNWNDPNHFIQGFYINQEIAIRWMISWSGRTQFYGDMASMVHTNSPTKKVMISPYKFDGFVENDNSITTDTYNIIYDNIYYLLQTTNVDIIAPQDSVGTLKVKTFNGNNTHYAAAKQAIVDANSQYGKHAVLWSNIETFHCVAQDQCVNPLTPTNFKTLHWQIRQSDNYAVKLITWIFQDTLAVDSLFYNNGDHTPTLEPARLALRQEYLNKPIITAAFTWYTPTRFVVKGYNFGNPGETIRMYLHYHDTQNVSKSYNSTSTIILDNRNLREISFLLSDIPGFDMFKPYEVLVVNSEGYFSSYLRDNPDINPEASFPEINAPFISTGDVSPSWNPWAVWLMGQNFYQNQLQIRLYDQHGASWVNNISPTYSGTNDSLTFSLPTNIPPSQCNIGQTCQVQVEVKNTVSNLVSNKFTITLPVATAPLPTPTLLPTPSPTLIPTPTPNPADINQSGGVNSDDLFLVIKNWLGTGICNTFQCDLNSDGKLNMLDAARVIANF